MSTELTSSADVQPATGERDQPGTLSGAPTVLPLVPGITRRPRGKRRPPGERPLPDAVAVRMLAIPDSAPPYDDEASPGAPAPVALGGCSRRGQPERAGQQPSRAAPPGGQRTSRAGSAGRASTAGGQRAGHRRAGRSRRGGCRGLGRAGGTARLAGTFAQVLAETLAGARRARSCHGRPSGRDGISSVSGRCLPPMSSLGSGASSTSVGRRRGRDDRDRRRRPEGAGAGRAARAGRPAPGQPWA